jgi:hypothetical protein
MILVADIKILGRKKATDVMCWLVFETRQLREKACPVLYLWKLKSVSVQEPKKKVVLPIRVLQWTADDLEGLMVPLFTVTQRILPREAVFSVTL